MAPARIIILALLIVLLVGALPTWPYNAHWGYGYYPSGGIGAVIILLLVLALLGII